MCKMITQDSEKVCIGENAIAINGAINIPKGEDREKFFKEFRKWLKNNNCSFFGMTNYVKTEKEAKEKTKEILFDYASEELEKNLENFEDEEKIIQLSKFKAL
ncbi:hypothetical protein HYH96_05685 [Clostridium botulinum]|uniref:Uncharacterized protein n=2 Tax=Clostridium botulinum TaxID=1491 RepID=A7GCT8_CLOBL|nr:hypothetical protein [Clostridium botulinum]ABS42918.1 hypothetical protein CLI_1333 [Clostridium botulinum F str. Langeland]ADF99053.1 hypothetical protein CBF_1306 [Clostridium botulinum F str. 230613]KKM43387.1 hypothetical protein VT72_07020 [Clostridium botulinum]MBD5643386.1 hypothetical protein [Clostridium botulinum]MBY6791096.1 hypothetical protein [Clostridium botulinum]